MDIVSKGKQRTDADIAKDYDTITLSMNDSSRHLINSKTYPAPCSGPEALAGGR